MLDVLETYQDIRRKLQQKKMGRGYKAQPTSWSLSGTVQGRLEQLKQKTKCHICKMPGHWKRECPKRRDKPSTSQSTRTAGVKEAMITDDGIDKHDGPEWFIPAEEIEQMDVFLVEGAGGSVDIVVAAQGETDCEQVDEVLGGLEKGLLSPRVFDDAPDAARSSDAYMAVCDEPVEYAPLTTHAVPDTACRRTLIGERVLRGLDEELRKRGLRVRYMSERHEFKFGNAGKLQTQQSVVIPACIGGKLVALKAAVLPEAGADTPLLLSKECLRGLKATLDMDRDVMYVGRLGVSVSLKETERGHYAIPILGCRVKRKGAGKDAVEIKTNEVHVSTCAATVGTSTASCESDRPCQLSSGNVCVANGHGGRGGEHRGRSSVAHGHRRDSPDARSDGSLGHRVSFERGSECATHEAAGQSRRSRRRRARRANQRQRDNGDREVRQGRDDEDVRPDLRGGQELRAVDQEVRDDIQAKLKRTVKFKLDDEAEAVHCVQRSAEGEACPCGQASGKPGGGLQSALCGPQDDDARTRGESSEVDREGKGHAEAGDPQQGHDEASCRFQRWLRELGGCGATPGSQPEGSEGADLEEDVAAAAGAGGLGGGGARGHVSDFKATSTMNREAPDHAQCSVMSKSEKQLCRAGLKVIGDVPGRSLGQMSGDVATRVDLLELFEGPAEQNAKAVGLTARHVLKFSKKFERYQRYFGDQMQSHVVRQLESMCPRMLCVSMPTELRDMFAGRQAREATYCNSYNRFANGLGACQESGGRLFAIEVGPSVKPHECIAGRVGMFCVSLQGLGTSMLTNCRELYDRLSKGTTLRGESDMQYSVNAVANLCVASVLDWKRSMALIVTTTCVHAVEDLRQGEGLTDQKIMVLLRKCHESRSPFTCKVESVVEVGACK